VSKLYKLFIDVDATQVEINPFAETPCGRGKHIIGYSEKGSGQ